ARDVLHRRQRPRDRPGRVGHGDAGPGGPVIEGEDLHASAVAINSRARARASGSFSGSLPPARAIVARPPPPPPTIGAISRTTSGWRERPCAYDHASPAVTASLRRAPEPTEPSERITNGPISAVERTCVPPQSSREKPSISTTRTSAPYFSPKSIIAPSLRASAIGVTNVRTGIASNTFSLTSQLIRHRL